jgi:hypothetical protein
MLSSFIIHNSSLFFIALIDKGCGKEGSWEDRKLGSWEKEVALRACLNACGGKQGSQEDRKL